MGERADVKNRLPGCDQLRQSGLLDASASVHHLDRQTCNALERMQDHEARPVGWKIRVAATLGRKGESVVPDLNRRGVPEHAFRAGTGGPVAHAAAALVLVDPQVDDL